MWTSTELASEQRRYAGTVWRLVEAQHRISTNRLAASRAEQEQLELLAEAVKPQLPASASRLDYLLASPFRYGHTQPSRFRKAHERPGIFYASESETTAIAESAYWRLRFFARSPGFAPPSTTSEHSSFRVRLACDRTLDLTAHPFAAEQARWTDPLDYSACQELAAQARLAETQAIRTLSARDRDRGCNLVVLSPTAFAERAPRHGKTWHLRYEKGRLACIAASPHDLYIEFTAADFGL